MHACTLLLIPRQCAVYTHRLHTVRTRLAMPLVASVCAWLISDIVSQELTCHDVITYLACLTYLIYGQLNNLGCNNNDITSMHSFVLELALPNVSHGLML